MAFGSGAVEGGRATLLSRRRHDWSRSSRRWSSGRGTPRPREAPCWTVSSRPSAPDGRTSLHAMHDGATIAYFVFDLLHLDSAEPELVRTDTSGGRCCCGGCSAPSAAPLRYVEHVVGGGGAFFQEACRQPPGRDRLQGRGVGLSSSARNATWQKTKCVLRQEFVIGGYERSAVDWARSGSATTTARHPSSAFSPGRRGPAFSARRAGDVRQAGARGAAPFAPKDCRRVSGFRGAVWIEPRIVCEVAFMEWTHHGHIRHASYQGLRLNKEARDVVREVARRAPPLPPTFGEPERRSPLPRGLR